MREEILDITALAKEARYSGVLYFLVALIAPFSLEYVPQKLYVRENAAATADNIRASESLLRIGITSELLHEVLWVFVVLALYQLLRRVNENRARQMLILGALIPVPVVSINVLNEIAAIFLVSGANFLAVFDRHQLDALALLFIRLHGHGLNVASIFWGLWLFPFAALVIRSGFIPRFLGVLLILAGTGYVISSLTTLMFPHYEHTARTLAGALEFGEVPIIFWLLIWGARNPKAHLPSGGTQEKSQAL